MTCALPAATIGATVLTKPTAPTAHPEHAIASAHSIAASTALNPTSYFTRSRLSREHHRRSERWTRQRFEPDIDKTGIAKPLRYFVERVVAAARRQQQVESEDRS